MTIRKKIVVSNILMIFIPIIVIIVMTIIIFNGAGSKYWETMENMYQDKNGLYSAQSIIFAYKDELSKQDTGESDSEETDGSSNKTTELTKELSNLGYHFSIALNEKLIFNNITQVEVTDMDSLIEDSFNSADSFTFTSGETSILKNTISENSNVFKIIAIHTADSQESPGVQSYLRKYVLSYLILLVACVLVVIFILNTLLSWWLSRNILKPLEKLSVGSRKIKDGDLDFVVDYNKSDEFGAVCKDFDEMRGHLKDSVEERLRYEKYRTQLLSGISHDIRTPLTSIKGYAEGLIDGIADTPKKQNRYYQAIHTRAIDMEELVDNLSTYTNLENNQIKYDFKNMDLNSYLGKVVEEYKLDAEKNKVRIKSEFVNENIMVNIDGQKLQRAILNIFANSIKYRNKDITSIKIITDYNEDYAIFSITDDGPGVESKDLDRIFECFYRGDSSRTKPAEGSGLGLSIVKQIIEGHNGKIKAENKNGLSITIWIPRCEELI